jgi:iron complex transport system ATP-binding protein
MSSGILTVNSISYTYHPERPEAVKQVSFEILSETVTAIIGPNGAGKTTLLHLMLGLMKPVTGSIFIEDVPISKYTRRELSQWIGLVPQSEYIPFEYTVLEYVLLGRAPYLGPLDLPGRDDVQIALESLAEIGIAHLEKRPVPALSGGELQLAMLARALCQKPRIMLLDEPTSHLDLSNRNTTLRILNRLRNNGTTIIFSTHDPEAAALIADHLVLMRNGQVLDAGTLDDTFTKEKLSLTYGTPVEVVNIDGMRVVRSMERLS